MVGSVLAAPSNGGCCFRLVLQVVAVLVGLMAVGLFQVQSAAAAGLCGTLVQPWGYPCTEYTVQTADGFLLGVQNIPYGLAGPSGASRTLVFLQHGLMAGGDNWVFNQPSESLGFILADAGYDVWIGNHRCIQWSHGHVSLTTNDAEYWDWTWDELAAYDLPAMLGLVYEETGSKIMYVAHSQGTSILIANLVGTDQPQPVTNMVAKAVLVCPIVYMDSITSVFIKDAADIYLDKIMALLGLKEFNLHSDVGQELVNDVCALPDVDCTDVYQAVTGNDCCMNATRVPFYTNFFPQTTSNNNMGHFAQMVRTNSFSKYDYGVLDNVVHYNQLTPPVYDVSLFPTAVPLMIVQGGQDALADPKNVQELISVLGSKVKQTLNVANYAHGDFVVSDTANVDVYPKIMTFLQN